LLRAISHSVIVTVLVMGDGMVWPMSCLAMALLWRWRRIRKQWPAQDLAG
jgi:hypothetical protein